MKVIFLDIDGVCNCYSTKEKSPGGYTGVEQRFISKIKEIVSATDAEIVLTSSWRAGWVREDTAVLWPDNPFIEDFLYLKEEFSKQGIIFLDRTPFLDSRGEEIETWIHNHQVSSFVILDDEISDLTNNIYCKSHIVQTSMKKGLTDGGVKMAVRMLSKEK